MAQLDKALQNQIKRLEAQLALPENKECFDCTSLRPRWASTNLGVFICMRCAGIHRSLGTHITKVKSINMDKWEEYMIQNLEQTGNEKASRTWLGKAPSGYRKPDANADSKDVERELRQKYEMKKYYVDDGGNYNTSPVPSNQQQSTATLAKPISVAPQTIRQQAPATQPAKTQQQSGGGVLWDDFKEAPASPPTLNSSPATPPVSVFPHHQQQQQQQQQQQKSLLDFDEPKKPNVIASDIMSLFDTPSQPQQSRPNVWGGQQQYQASPPPPPNSWYPPQQQQQQTQYGNNNNNNNWYANNQAQQQQQYQQGPYNAYPQQNIQQQQPVWATQQPVRNW